MAPLIYNTRAVLGTCATFSTTAPLARNKKGGARRGGATVKKARWQWGKEKMALNRAILEPTLAYVHLRFLELTQRF